MYKTAAVINFCSNEYRFLKPCVEQARKFAHVIHIAICDHLFDGQPEDRQAIKNIAEEFPDVRFFLYPFLAPPFFGKKCSASDVVHMRHNVSRMVGFHFLPPEIEYVLFLDADEVVDGERFSAWHTTSRHLPFAFMKLCCYWYFREPCFQARQWETSPLFAKRRFLTRKLIMQKDERTGMFLQGKGAKAEGIVGLDGKPMVHHYSWVRTKGEMLKKVCSWGHAKDRDWEGLVHEEFAGPFKGRDFVHGYDFSTVEPFAAIDFSSSPKKNSSSHSFVEIGQRQLLRIVRGRWWLF